MGTDLAISIITPSFNRADELGHLFQSLENQSTDPASFESIISDDGSTDGTEALVKAWQQKAHFKIKYITQANQGPGAARNHGLINSEGDLILFIDSDCEAHPDWIKTIVEEYRSAEFDACGGPDGAKEDFTVFQKAIDYSMTSFFTTGGMRGHSDKMMAKFYPRTHNMGITRRVYEAVGGFGDLRHGQDIEFSNRIRKSGADVRFIKDAVVYHRRRTSLRQFFKQVFNWGVARINLGKIDSAMLEPIHFLPTLASLSALLVLSGVLYLGFPVKQVFMLFFIPLCLLSLWGSVKKSDIRVFPYLLIVIPAQVLGYGVGFFQAFIRRYIFNQAESVGFKKNYYK